MELFCIFDLLGIEDFMEEELPASSLKALGDITPNNATIKRSEAIVEAIVATESDCANRKSSGDHANVRWGIFSGTVVLRVNVNLFDPDTDSLAVEIFSNAACFCREAFKVGLLVRGVMHLGTLPNPESLSSYLLRSRIVSLVGYAKASGIILSHEACDFIRMYLPLNEESKERIFYEYPIPFDGGKEAVVMLLNWYSHSLFPEGIDCAFVKHFAHGDYNVLECPNQFLHNSVRMMRFLESKSSRKFFVITHEMIGEELQRRKNAAERNRPGDS